MATEQIKVLIIDDSAYSRRTIGEILESTGMCRVIGTARDGEDGVKKALELKPDLITLDLEMPKMDGFTFLRIIMKSQPTPILVISSMAHRKLVFRAMELGATDFLAKPDPNISNDLYDIKEDLINKVTVVGQLQLLNIQRRLKKGGSEENADLTPPPTKIVPREKREGAPGTFDCLAIGSSTGGPSALQEILTSLPADFDLPMVIGQHMPAGFTRAFAERLNKYSPWNVKEAEHGEPVIPNSAYIAPGGHHMRLALDGNGKKIHVSKKSPGDKYVPSIDELFKSAAAIYGSRLLAVVLTGMGNDGTAGAKSIKEKNGTVYTESQETAIVYGMPREVAEAGLSDKTIPLDKISIAIAAAIGRKKGNNRE